MVDVPKDNWCDSGHSVKDDATFKRGGPDSPADPIRFFNISYQDKGINKTCCEPCLVLINFLAKAKKDEALQMEKSISGELYNLNKVLKKE